MFCFFLDFSAPLLVTLYPFLITSPPPVFKSSLHIILRLTPIVIIITLVLLLEGAYRAFTNCGCLHFRSRLYGFARFLDDLFDHMVFGSSFFSISLWIPFQCGLRYIFNWSGRLIVWPIQFLFRRFIVRSQLVVVAEMDNLFSSVVLRTIDLYYPSLKVLGNITNFFNIS